MLCVVRFFRFQEVQQSKVGDLLASDEDYIANLGVELTPVPELLSFIQWLCLLCSDILN